MVNLQSLWIIFSLCVVQLPNTNLTKIIITLLNMFSFFLPFWAVSEPYNIVYLFSFDRLLVTSVIFIMYSATMFARLLNFKTSFLNIKIERLNIRRPVQERPWNNISRYYSTIFNSSFSSSLHFFKKALCFLLGYCSSCSPIAKATFCQLRFWIYLSIKIIRILLSWTLSMNLFRRFNS